MRINAICLLRSLVVVCVALAATAANCAFVVDEFTVPAGDYRYRDGVGWSGRRAIVFESSEPCRGPCPHVGVKLENGFQYEFTAIVQARLSPGSIVEISLSWYDVNGNRIGATTGTPVNDNEILPDGWIRYGATTPIIPPEAASASLHMYVCHGGSGRAVFDRVTLTRLEPKWIGRMLTSAYQDTAHEGRVRFVVPLTNFDALRIPADRLDARFKLVGSDGSARRLRPTKIAADYAELDIGVDELAMGRNAVSFGARTKERVFGTTRTFFTRTAKRPERRVWIDAKKRLIVDGKPFFMLGCYWRTVTREQLELFTPSPFNTILPCNDPGRDQLDLCQQYGVKICYPFEHRYDVPGESTNVVRIVNELKNHPALLLWYLNDERPASLAAQVQERHDLIRSLDDQHPTWSVTDKPMLVRDFLGTYEIIGTDPYPIGLDSDPYPHPIEFVTMCARVTRDRSYDLYPIWSVPQAFNWAWYRKKKSAWEWKDVRYPTRDELRQMTWQHLAAGANGIMYYAFNSLQDGFGTGTEFQERWNELKEVAGEVLRYRDIFLSDEDPPKVLAGETEKVGVRAWRHHGEIWLLVVNASREPQKATVRLDSSDRTYEYSLGPIEWSFRNLSKR